jgi:TonB-linked SusC/RagA family outer membrane protein
MEKAMKLVIILLTIALGVSAGGFSQTITFSGKDVPLQKVFAAIKKQTGYLSVYDYDLVESAKPVTLSVYGMPLGDFLDAVFRDQPLKYAIDNRTILITRKAIAVAPPLAAASAAIAADAGLVSITGQVVNGVTNEPLAGASLTLKGQKGGAATAADGRFILRNIPANAILSVSSLGYAPMLIAVSRLQEMSPGRSLRVGPGHVTHGTGELLIFSLSPSDSKLDDAQVIAYGTTTMRFNVGSISKVSREEIASQPVFDPIAALEGRVPGLLVTTTSGVPGAPFKIQVRGQNTLGNIPGRIIPDNPYIIIDGVPFGPQNSSLTALQTVNDIGATGLPGTGMSPLSTINPADIESIEVLKDADATAIYGARGANGVILITTRKNAAGKTSFNTSVYTGYNTLSRTMPLLSTPQYLALRRQAFLNDGVAPDSVSAPDLFVFDTTRHTNFLHDFFGLTAPSVSVNSFLEGGTATNTFSLGAGYDRIGNLFPGNFDNNRVSISARLHHNSTDRRLNIDFISNFSYSKDNVPGSPSITQAYTLAPDFPALRHGDSLVWSYKGVGFSNIYSGFANPLSYLKQTEEVSAYTLVGSMQIGYEVLPGLTVRSNFGFNSVNTREMNISPLDGQDPLDSYKQATSQRAAGGNYSWTIEPQVNYNRKFGLSRLDALAGATFQDMTSNTLTVTGTNYTNDALLRTISAAGAVTSNEAQDIYKYNGGFGRVNYIFNNKYIVNLTGRVDGSSRFRPGKQWGHFGAVGAGWIFSEEKFFKTAVPVISYGKIRGSYGTTGNDNVGNYQYQANWGPQGSIYNYNGSNGYSPLNLANPDFSWSTTKKTELGLELGFWGDKLLVTGDWYMNRSGNQLVQYTLPTQTGFRSVTKNFEAVVENTGWEFVLSSTPVKTKIFSWRTAFNLSIPRNKLAAFPNIESSPYYLTYTVGKSLTTIRGYKYEGINDTTGVYQFRTQQGGISSRPSAYNKDNQFILGNFDPTFYGGFRNTFSYKGWQLDIFLEFRKQRGNTYQASLGSPPGTLSNIPVDALNTWKNPGDHARYQRLTQDYSSGAFPAQGYYNGSDGVIGDASYIRAKTVGVSYSINSNLIRKIGMNACRLYVNAQNLFTITGYRGNDPESQQYYGVPPLRTVATGLNFNF